MPPRSVIAAIVVFWLAVMAWLVRSEIYPRLVAGEPPPFALDLLDSSQAQPGAEVRKSEVIPLRRTDSLPTANVTTWKVTATPIQGGDPVLTRALTTWLVHYPGTDFIDLHAILNRKRHDPRPTFDLSRLETVYRLRGRGASEADLVGVEAVAEAGPLQSRYVGEIRDGRCDLRWSTRTAGGAAREGILQIATPVTGLVILPLHPVHRMRGVRSGRTWIAPFLDPLHGIGVASGPSVAWAHVEVEEQRKSLLWKGRERSCLIVSYKTSSGSVQGRTWVEPAEDYRVLRLQADLGDNRWEITRE